MLYSQESSITLDETQYPHVIQDLFKVLKPLGGLDAVDQAVRSAKEQDPETLERFGIRNAEDFINWIASFLTWVPFENDEARVVYDMACMFYFVFSCQPLISEQTPITPESEGKPLTALSRWLVKYAKVMGEFMSTPASMTPETFSTFQQSRHYRVFECTSPDGSAFRTFNDFFGRKLRVPRQIDGPGDNRVVTYAADSAFDNAFDIRSDSTIEVPTDRWEDDGNPITAKSLTWSIQGLLDHSRLYESAFAGGVWMHSFLNTFNYHRFHAPVSGTVVEARVIQQASYLDAVAEDGKLLHRRRVRIPKDKEEDNDMSGFQFLQTRGLIIIDTSTSEDGDIGLVAVLPIGMAQVSSVQLSVSPASDLNSTKPHTVKKGEELGFFQFGGSDMVVVFQEKAGISKDGFHKQPSEGTDNRYTFYGQTLVRAKPKY